MSAELDAFMATMTSRAAPTPLERVRELAAERYGLRPEVCPLTGERDENFRLTCPGGEEYVLKIANAAESEAVTELQTAALRHLERADPGLPVPRILRTLDGQAQTRFTDPVGRLRTVRVLGFLPGRLLADCPRSAAQRIACGRLGGRLSRALRDFGHPAAARAVVWDVRHAGYLGTLLTQMPQFPCGAEAAALLERLTPVLAARWRELPEQVVHNDLNPRNILLDPEDPVRIVGVIDFGDLTRTAVIADVAVAAAELIPEECPDPAQARGGVLEVLQGYRERLALARAELAVLGSLIAARLAMNVVVHEWHVAHNPPGGHHAPLTVRFMRERLRLALRLTEEDFGG